MRRTRALAAPLAASLVAGSLVALAVSTPASADPPTPDRDPADTFVSAHPAALHTGPYDALVRTGVHSGTDGLRYVSYERTHRGLPVIGGDAVVMLDAKGAVVTAATAQSSTVDVATTPTVPAEKAAQAARDGLRTVESVARPALAVLAWGPPTLVWDTVVAGRTAENTPSVRHVYVDARTGTVAGSKEGVRAGTGTGFYNGAVTVPTTGSGGAFSMADPSRPGVRCGGMNGQTFTGTDDVWGNGAGTDLETACVDVLYAMAQEWDMLGAWLGRNGIDGNGGAFPAQVGLTEVNAYWFGDHTEFGHSSDGQRQVTPIDVVAHEYGHAIFDNTPGGSGGSLENGGLNEGTGDLFGAMTEAYANNPNDPPDFEVGEEVDLVGGGPIRYMYKPSLKGHPDCWTSTWPTNDVHAVAGPLNHWFYLVSQGSSPAGGPASPICAGGPSSVTGIGLQSAAKVYYNAMHLKTSTWDYGKVRTATLTAAKALYPTSCTVFDTIRSAWNAVSVPAQSAEPTCTAPPANDFTVALSTSSATVAAGSTTTATVSTTVSNGSPQTVTFSTDGLPAGASATVNPAFVSAGGSATVSIATQTNIASGAYTVTVYGTGSTGLVRSASLVLTITGGTGCAGPGQKLGNPGFETGSAPWVTSNGGIVGTYPGQNAHSGTRFAWLRGYGAAGTDTLAQTVTLPTGCATYALSFWLHIDTAEPATAPARDTLKVQVVSPTGTVTTVASYSNADRAPGYAEHTLDLNPWAGQQVTLRVEATENANARQTSFVLDDTSLVVS
jgi:Zn-dependent metalloprotease